MRKKQRATRTTFEETKVEGVESVVADSGSTDIPMVANDDTVEQVERDANASPVYKFDSSGTATLPDGTVVVQPVSADLTASGSRSGSLKGPIVDISATNIPTAKCTVCGMEMDPATSMFSIHPILQVLRCLPCAKFYRKQEFLRDSDGKDEYCRWCADGGDLICCDHCSNAFCKRCIKRNLGRSALSSIESMEESALWTCYVCDPSPIEPLKILCSEVLIKVDKLKALKRRRSERAYASWKTRCSSKGLSTGTAGTTSGSPSVSTPNTSSDETLKTLTSLFSQWSQSMPESTNQADSNGLPDMGNLLQLMGQTLNTTNTGTSIPPPPTVISPSLPIQPPGWFVKNNPIGRPTTLARCVVVNNTPSTTVLPNAPFSSTVPTVSSNSELSAILNQITSVNESNIRIALKAARRCIETFSADIRRLEQMAAKAGTVNDLGRVVRSFHSIYRFHLFARLSNLAARMREEIPKVPEKSRVYSTTSAPKSNPLFLHVGPVNVAGLPPNPIAPPSGLTIDLTDEADVSRESNDPSPHAQPLHQEKPTQDNSVLPTAQEPTKGGPQKSTATSNPDALKVSSNLKRDDNPAKTNPTIPSSSPRSNSSHSELSNSFPVTSDRPASSPNSNVIPVSAESSGNPSEPICSSAQPVTPSSTTDAEPEPSCSTQAANPSDLPNPNEAEDLAVDDDDDDDIDWKLDMLANLSQTETPSLMFSASNHAGMHKDEPTRATTDTPNSVRRADTGCDSSENTPLHVQQSNTVPEPSVYLEDIRDQLGEDSFVRLKNTSDLNTTQSTSTESADVTAPSPKAPDSSEQPTTQDPSDSESDVDLASLEATVSSLERRCGRVTKVVSRRKTRSNVRSTASVDRMTNDQSDEEADLDAKATKENAQEQKKKLSTSDNPVDLPTTSRSSSTPKRNIRNSSKTIGCERSTGSTASKKLSDDEQIEDVAIDCTDDSYHIEADVVPAVMRTDALRDELLTETDTQYAADLAYREQLLRDSSDDEIAASEKLADNLDDSSSTTKTMKTARIKPECSTEDNGRLPKVSSEVDTAQSLDSTKRKANCKYHGVNKKLMERIWSSSEDEKEKEKHKSNIEPNLKNKNELKVEMQNDADASTDEDTVNKGGKRSRPLGESDSSSSTTESIQKINPRKKRRRNQQTDALQSDASSDAGDKPRSGSKASNVDSDTDKQNVTDDEEDDSDFVAPRKHKSNREPKPQKKKRRRRRVRLEAGSDKEGSGDRSDGALVSDDSQDSADLIAIASNSGSDGGTDEKSKGRKRIRKIYTQTKLSETTKTAEAEERERRKRLAERQKMYNDCLIQEGTGTDVITKKLVLEKSKDGSKDLVEVHPDILKHLKPHQVEAIRFLWDCVIESVENQDAKNEQTRGAILAHCMGLGKTLSVIAFLHTLFAYPDLLRIRTCLVICPVNTLLNWKNEWDIWLPPDDPLDVFELSARPDNRQRVAVLKHWHNRGGVLLLGYDMFRNFVVQFTKRGRSKMMKEAVNEALLDPGPDIVVCDEGHVLKNCKSALAKAMSQVRTLKRIVLTGTPLQNNLTEYHAMVSFVKPNLLGTAKEFNNRFANPIKNGQHSNSTQLDVQIMKKRAHVLYKTLDGCVQRKDYAALTKYLPPRYEYIVKCRLSSVQQEFYRLFLQHRAERSLSDADNETGRVPRKTLFTDQQTLYRVWTHPFLLRSHENREARKMLLENDDFIDDEPSVSSESSSEVTLVESSDSSKEGADEVIPAPTSSNARARKPSRRGPRTRSRGTDLHCLDSDSDPAERDGNRLSDTPVSEEDESRSLGVRDSWWSAHYRDDYDWDVSIGVKLDVLLRILKKACDIGDKLIIFTQSLLSLDLLERFLGELHRQWLANQGLAPDKQHKTDDRGQVERPDLSEYFSDMGRNSWVRGEDYERMDGSTNAVVRKELQRRFNRVANTRLRLFLISTRAGGLGINLIAGNRIILFDACWNPSHDIQSIFRCYRFGQTKPVYIYRLIAQGTMEEIIYDRQVTKQSLSLRVIDEQQIDRHFTHDDLQALYTFEPDLWDPASADQRPTPKLPKDRLLADMLSEYPNLIVTYHEHDSLLEHREDEGLTEEQRQEAWREYEEEKLYGMSLAQHQRLMQQQEIQARFIRMHQQQTLLEQQQLRFPMHSAPYRPLVSPYNPIYPGLRNAAPIPMDHGMMTNPMMMAPNQQANGNLYVELFEYFRTQLLNARPSLSGDPEQLKRLIMGNMMDHLVRTKALDPTQLQSTSNPTTAPLNQPGPSG